MGCLIFTEKILYKEAKVSNNKKYPMGRVPIKWYIYANYT